MTAMIKVEHLKKSFGKKKSSKIFLQMLIKEKLLVSLVHQAQERVLFYAVSMCLKRQLVARLFLMDKI